MEQLSSLVVGHAAGKVIDGLTAVFRVQVIERWSKHRARQFFDEFCRELEKEMVGAEPGKVNELLEAILADQAGSETLFDAYRQVSLAKSKTLGPRIIGIMTARLVIEKRTADDVEERILAAAEQLSDGELLSFASFVREQRALVDKGQSKEVYIDERGTLFVVFCNEQFDYTFGRDQPVSLGPLDLNESFGVWAAKLKNLGLVADDVKERWSRTDWGSDRHIDTPGAGREVSWGIYVPKRHLMLADLVERAAEVS